MVRLGASDPTDISLVVFLLGRELRLLQTFTSDAKLLKEAAQRAMSIDGANLQVKDPRDDPFSSTSLMEEMAGAEGQNDIPGGAPRGSNSAALLAMKAMHLQQFEKERYAESMHIRPRLTLDALKIIARHLRGYPGRKNISWLSPAFPLVIMPAQNAPLYTSFAGIPNYRNELSGVTNPL